MKVILALMLLTLFAMQACAAKPDASLPRPPQPAGCPAPGDVVAFRNVTEVYASMAASLTGSNLWTKGEFETTAQFEARKAKAIAAADFPRIVRLEGTYNPEFVEYDADNQHFVISSYAWDIMHVSWSLVFDSGNPYGIGPLFSSDSVRGIGLVKDVSTTYGVFDKRLPFYPERQEWVNEIATGYDDDLCARRGICAVLLPVPLQHAPELKDKMRVGVVVRPKAPFTAAWGSHKLIVADILCAVITDQDGLVLKTVATGP